MQARANLCNQTPTVIPSSPYWTDYVRGIVFRLCLHGILSLTSRLFRALVKAPGKRLNFTSALNKMYRCTISKFKAKYLATYAGVHQLDPRLKKIKRVEGGKYELRSVHDCVCSLTSRPQTHFVELAAVFHKTTTPMKMTRSARAYFPLLTRGDISSPGQARACLQIKKKL